MEGGVSCLLVLEVGRKMASLFERPIEDLKGIGEKKGKLYRKLGINTVGALIRFYPRAYEDWSKLTPIENIVPGESFCIKGRLVAPLQERMIPGGKLISKGTIYDDDAFIPVTFFNNRYISSMLKENETYLFYGKAVITAGRVELVSPEFSPESKAHPIRPIYPQTAGLTSRQIERSAVEAFKLMPEKIKDPIPQYIMEKYSLSTLEFALNNIHFPKDDSSLLKAKKRLAFEELLFLNIGLYRLKSEQEKETSIKIESDFSAEFFKSLPFEPTNAQLKATQDCIHDISQKTSPMNRLIQGDVGSGKTAIAAAICYTMAKNGWQSAFMAPTEILAQQHFTSLSGILNRFSIRISLLTGSMTAKEKRLVKESLANGETDIIIGTHALISDAVEFSRLGLVVTDEQHRFGVSQRTKLLSKGENPHLLVMSATPIPRTLALIIYGDLDISVVDEMPKGRQKIDTLLIDSKKKKRMFGFLKKHMEDGRQCYIVCPAVEESDIPLISAEEYYNQLKDGEFRDYKLGLLHRQMKPKDKDKVMKEFSEGKIGLLVSTTVVEVGVDVPNATIMVIENAERFGLSQLHQLRGRVGRGQHKSYCILVSDNLTELSKERLQTMCRTSNGFEIAEMDLKLRGPGDFFGSRQHGLPEMKIADFADMNTVSQAQNACREILLKSPDLSDDSLKTLKSEVTRLFGKERWLN